MLEKSCKPIINDIPIENFNMEGYVELNLALADWKADRAGRRSAGNHTNRAKYRPEFVEHCHTGRRRRNRHIDSIRAVAIQPHCDTHNDSRPPQRADQHASTAGSARFASFHVCPQKRGIPILHRAPLRDRSRGVAGGKQPLQPGYLLRGLGLDHPIGSGLVRSRFGPAFVARASRFLCGDRQCRYNRVWSGV